MKWCLTFLFLASPSWAAFTVVQSTNCTSNATAVSSKSCTFNSTPSAGNAIVATCTTYDFNGTITSAVTDNQLNSYHLDISTTEGNSFSKIRIGISHADNIAASGTFSITCTPSASDYIDMAGYEVSGGALSSFDFGASSMTFSTTVSPTMVSTASTSVSNELVFVSIGHNNKSAVTAGAGYTLGGFDRTTGDVLNFADEYSTTSVVGTQAAGFSYGTGLTDHAMVMATYLPAAAAVPRPGNLLKINSGTIIQGGSVSVQ